MHDLPITISMPQGATIGGITTWAVRLAAGVTDAGRTARLVVHRPSNDLHEMDIQHWPGMSKIEVVRAPTLADPADVQACIRVYRDLLPTILLPNVLAESYAIAAALATAHSDVLRVLGWNHSDNPYDYATLAYYEPIIHSFIANTSRCVEQLGQHVPTRQGDIAHILHGVAIPADTPRPPLAGRPIRLMYAGRMEQLVKRTMDFITLAELLIDLNVQFAMTLIGDGPQAGDLDQAIIAMADRLRASGSSLVREPPIAPHHMPKRWRSADVAILASVHEGLSMQMLETMAAGCVPVVSRVASGTAEIVSDGNNGFTFPPGDTEAMAAHIARLASNESTLRACARAARKTIADRCDEDRFLSRVLQVFDAAENEPGRPWPTRLPIDMNGQDRSCRATVPSDAAAKLTRLLDTIARQAVGPIAIYGGGGHTIALGDIWAASPVEIVAVVDDDPGRHGQRLWGWPIMDADSLLATSAKSVVISSWMHEEAIWNRTRALATGGLRVFRLYGRQTARDTPVPVASATWKMSAT